ncbi:MAG: class I SAM-dependent methyltransferase [Polyangiales bacterium]
MILVGYTTRYRGGSEKFRAAAETMHRELREKHPSREVRLVALERKSDFVAEMERIENEGKRLAELHFVGHSGMYGIMFGSTSWPEQFSPHEWRTMRIPFAEGASAHFHACRTARWFAPFFARTFGVRTFGHHGYTTVSIEPERFVWEGLRFPRSGPTYLVSVPGRKTHGLAGSLRKYLLRPPVEPMLGFEPIEPEGETGYDAVSALYDRAFADIRVRRDEYAWVTKALARARKESGRAPRVLDVGCGNGALLLALEDRLARGVGVDVSRGMIAKARERAEGHPKLSFEAISGPELPCDDASFDVIVSFLSFRYLDWDPIVREMRRVLAPGGRILVVDMVEKPLEAKDAPVLARSALAHVLRPVRDPRFHRDVQALVSHPDWATMLKHNPIRAEHEYRWYLESRFPGRRLETLNVGRTQRLVAFDTGPLEPGTVAPLSYP